VYNYEYSYCFDLVFHSRFYYKVLIHTLSTQNLLFAISGVNIYAQSFSFFFCFVFSRLQNIYCFTRSMCPSLYTVHLSLSRLNDFALVLSRKMLHAKNLFRTWREISILYTVIISSDSRTSIHANRFHSNLTLLLISSYSLLLSFIECVYHARWWHASSSETRWQEDLCVARNLYGVAEDQRKRVWSYLYN